MSVRASGGAVSDMWLVSIAAGVRWPGLSVAPLSVSLNCADALHSTYLYGSDQWDTTQNAAGKVDGAAGVLRRPTGRPDERFPYQRRQ